VPGALNLIVTSVLWSVSTFSTSQVSSRSSETSVSLVFAGQEQVPLFCKTREKDG